MLCEKCHQHNATVHVTEITDWHGVGSPDNQVNHQHLCEVCGQHADLPFSGPSPKLGGGVWSLINVKAQSAGARCPSLACEQCGLDLEEFRRHGRLGCEHCYEVFAAHLTEMLERMHGATEHVGRLPAVDEEKVERQRRTSELRCELESAIAEEAYERAAGLRDELRALGADEGGTPA